MTSPRIAVCLHLFVTDLIPEFQQYLSNINKAGYTYDLYVSVLKGTDHSIVKRAWPKAKVLERDNRGFDIASFLSSLHYILPNPSYDYILKLHTKTNTQWRKELVQPLLATPARVRHALELLSNEDTGMVGCEKWLIPLGLDWGVNAIHAKSICQQWNVPLQPCTFVGGTIFWIKVRVLHKAVGKLNLLQLADNLNTVETLDHSWYLMTYPELRSQGVISEEDAILHWKEKGKKQGRACNCLYARINHVGTPNCDGMTEHSYERFFGLLVAHASKEVKGISSSNLLTAANLKVTALYHPAPDWEQVKKAAQSIQPRTYYNGLELSVLQKQCATMKGKGLDAVCYRLSPSNLNFIELLPSTSFPFFLSWGDGMGRKEIVRIAALFSLPNYLRVEGKPVLYFEGKIPSNVTSTEFHIITNGFNIPATHTMQYNGIALEEEGEGRSLGGKLVEYYHSLLSSKQQPIAVLKSWNDWEGKRVLEESKEYGYRNMQEVEEVRSYFS